MPDVTPLQKEVDGITKLLTGWKTLREGIPGSGDLAKCFFAWCVGAKCKFCEKPGHAQLGCPCKKAVDGHMHNFGISHAWGTVKFELWRTNMSETDKLEELELRQKWAQNKQRKQNKGQAAQANSRAQQINYLAGRSDSLENIGASLLAKRRRPTD